MKHERPVAAIDIGSNSVFLQVVAVVDGRPGRVLARVKHKARLGAHIGADGRFTEDAVARAVSALEGFAEVIAGHDAQVRATATAAVRRASNGGALLERIRTATGIEVELISGRREAELVFLGVQANRPDTGRVLCADVGGGSTELIVGEGAQIHSAVSLPVGAVTLSHPRLLQAPVPATSIAAARHAVRVALADQTSAGQGGWQTAVATSGSAQRIARIVRARGGGSLRRDVDGVVFTRADLAQLCDVLARARDHSERLAVPGMDAERADVLLGGAVIFDEVSAALGVTTWQVSMAGLRAGLVEDALRSRRGNP